MTPEDIERLEGVILRTKVGVGMIAFARLNPEQKMAYCLQRMIEAGKEKLLLLELSTYYAKQLVEWRATDEGKAYAEYQATKRLPKPDPDA